MGAALKIECVDKLGVLIDTKKRIKILVGGRGSTKSTFVADYVLSKVQNGQTWCCGREYQNSIDDSVHSLLLDEIERCGFQGFNPMKSEIPHESGGKAFYRGLARNITSLKGINANGLWIEEGESLSTATLKILTASIRVSALEAQRAKEQDREVEPPEIWITLNRGASNDPIAKKFLKRAEKDLEKYGFYEDDMMMIVQINYDDIPREWFLSSGLEVERADDNENMSRAEYDAKWHGKYSDTVENAIIKPEWFDACIDAHEKLGFKAQGAIVVAHDPSDEGSDNKGYACRHGSVFTQISEMEDGNVNEGCDWATDTAIEDDADLFTWDGDGLGVTLRRQIEQAFDGKKIDYQMYKGSEKVDNPKEIYEPTTKTDKSKARTNEQTFRNKRAQYCWKLRDRMFKTYMAIEKGQYSNPDEMISISSQIENLDQIRSEVCRVPRVRNGNGFIQIMRKDEMLRKHKIQSGNMFDSMAMSLVTPNKPDETWELESSSLWD